MPEKLLCERALFRHLGEGSDRESMCLRRAQFDREPSRLLHENFPFAQSISFEDLQLLVYQWLPRLGQCDIPDGVFRFGYLRSHFVKPHPRLQPQGPHRYAWR